ncbi:hypothetical protein IFM46972_03536 [Aspergillus udagawae]|uniref:Uncharacterized protein n=1 Tax=Aspergillus udagawae TaxID=91492 RepID=A0A8H3RP36_9EURO|nr:hypothetical protein IFM46972_03536 [Aspergillus udagawae]
MAFVPAFLTITRHPVLVNVAQQVKDVAMLRNSVRQVRAAAMGSALMRLPTPQTVEHVVLLPILPTAVPVPML